MQHGKPTNSIDMLAKYVKGIDRFLWPLYDLTFRHYRTGKIEYVRDVRYEWLLTAIHEYLVTHCKACVGVFQDTLDKSKILILITG